MKELCFQNATMERFKKIDLFGRLFVFEMNKNDRMHRTAIGSILTLLMVPVTLIYGIMQFNVMIYY